MCYLADFLVSYRATGRPPPPCPPRAPLSTSFFFVSAPFPVLGNPPTPKLGNASPASARGTILPPDASLNLYTPRPCVAAIFTSHCATRRIFLPGPWFHTHQIATCRFQGVQPFIGDFDANPSTTRSCFRPAIRILGIKFPHPLALSTSSRERARNPGCFSISCLRHSLHIFPAISLLCRHMCESWLLDLMLRYSLPFRHHRKPSYTTPLFARGTVLWGYLRDFMFEERTLGHLVSQSPRISLWFLFRIAPLAGSHSITRPSSTIATRLLCLASGLGSATRSSSPPKSLVRADKN
ncbi:hypothetical protein FB451DRAFT_1327396 [Mycena latifolia]|nr:hypothetical protein FB451DRAFT_1327396 [Mycena latifolia]